MIYFLSLGLFTFLVLYVISQKINKEKYITLKQSEHPLKLFYPMLDMFHISQLKVGAVIILIFLLTFLLSFLIEIKQLSKPSSIIDNKIIRPDTGSGNMYVFAQADTPFGLNYLDLYVEEQIVPKNERDTMFQNAILILEKIILDKNSSWDNIQYNLNLVKSIPNTQIYVEYSVRDKEYIDSHGQIQFDNLSFEETQVDIEVHLKYEESTMKYQFTACIKKNEISTSKEYASKLEKSVEDLNETTKDSKYYLLPKSVDGYDVIWSEAKSNKSILILGIGIILCLLTPWFIDKKEKENKEKDNQQMLVDYPEIISKFTLFVNAGMTTKAAWNRIVSDYATHYINTTERVKKEKKRVAYEQMIATKNEQDMGISEETTYYNFGKHCMLLPYLRFSSILVQNLRKGGKTMISLLEAEASEAFLERIENAKRQGEKASTKLLGPSVGMLLIVLFIIMIPAFLSF